MLKTDCYAGSMPCATAAVLEKIPMPVQMAIWRAIDRMPRPRDNLQVFDLSRDTREGRVCQIIRHTQEEPLYYQEYALPCAEAVDGYKALVIAEDGGEYSLLMLAVEW